MKTRERTWMVSFLPTRIDACSRALTTLMYESCIDVYFPTRTMLTVSKSRSCLKEVKEFEARGQLRLCSPPSEIRARDENSPRSQLLPPGHQALSPCPSPVSNVDGREVQPRLKVGDESLVLKEERDVVGRLDVVDSHDLSWRDVTEHRDLVHS